MRRDDCREANIEGEGTVHQMLRQTKGERSTQEEELGAWRVLVEGERNFNCGGEGGRNRRSVVAR